MRRSDDSEINPTHSKACFISQRFYQIMESSNYLLITTETLNITDLTDKQGSSKIEHP
jgi:hypothetical protein